MDIDLDEANEGVDTDGEEIAPDDVVGEDCMMAALTVRTACWPKAALMG